MRGDRSTFASAMKYELLRTCLLLGLALCISGIRAQEYQHLLKGFDDNDGIDIRGMGTDEGYTNGTRIDLYHIARQPRSFINRLMPKAGDSAVNTSGWGLMQVMYTPTEIRTPVPDPNDYHYAGGLYISHTLHSANARKKLNIQSEIVLGVMGPPSLAADFQRLIHSIGGFVKPRGWDYQLPTDLLLNYNMMAEKQLGEVAGVLDYTAGASLMAGTYQTSAQLYTLLRIGKRFGYYDGLIQQYNRKSQGSKPHWQLYGLLQPAIQWTGYQAMIQGGVLNSNSPLYAKINNQNHAEMRPEPWMAQLDFGIVAASGNLSLLWKQSLRTREVQNLQPHSVGTISVQIAW